MKLIIKIAFYLYATIGFSSSSAGSYEDFFTAVTRDDGRAVVALLNRGFDPNSKDPKGNVALFLAVRDGAQSVTDGLLQHPSLDLDAATVNGETALMMAALKGNVDLSKKLVERGAALNRSGWTPLHYAATGPATDLVRWMIERKAFIDARSPNGSTPLMMAAGYGAETSVIALLDLGADPKLANQVGLSAADFAARAGREKLQKRLQALAAGRSP